MSATLSHVAVPSSARYVSLDGFVPVPRGTPPATPTLPSWPIKDPNDVLDYQFDIATALSGNAGDGIASVTVAISPANPGDLTLASVSADGTAAVMWLAAGQSGTTYTVTLTIGTLAGRTLVRSVLLPVLSLGQIPTPPNGLLTQAGSPLTDQYGNPILISS